MRIIDGTGTVNTFAGGGSSTSSGIPATSASFGYVWGIAIDGSNNIFVADRGSRVWMVNAIVSSAGVTDSFSVSFRSSCSGPRITAITRRYATGMTISTTYGDGTTDTIAVAARYGGGGYAVLQHSYAASGTYNIQMVLYNGTTPQDTITQTFVHRLCNELRVRTYVDNNSNCTFDTSERALYSSFTAAVDSNGVTIDTSLAPMGLTILLGARQVRFMPSVCFAHLHRSILHAPALVCSAIRYQQPYSTDLPILASVALPRW